MKNMNKKPKRLIIACVVFLIGAILNLVIPLINFSAIQNSISNQPNAYIAGVWFRIIAPQLLLIYGAIGIWKGKANGRKIALIGLLLGLWPSAQDFYRGFLQSGSSKMALPITIAIFSVWISIWLWCLYSKKSTAYLKNENPNQ